MAKALFLVMHEINDIGDGVATQRSDADRLKDDGCHETHFGSIQGKERSD